MTQKNNDVKKESYPDNSTKGRGRGDHGGADMDERSNDPEVAHGGHGGDDGDTHGDGDDGPATQQQQQQQQQQEREHRG